MATIEQNFGWATFGKITARIPPFVCIIVPDPNIVSFIFIDALTRVLATVVFDIMQLMQTPNLKMQNVMQKKIIFILS